jgi:integrase
MLENPSLSDYALVAFDLYLTYIRRYNLKYHHLRQAQRLICILEKDPPIPFKSWMDVYQYDEKYPLPHKPNTKKGHAILKIGFMLQELGVLPPKEEELGRQIKNLRSYFSTKEQAYIGEFLESLKHQHREQATLRHCLTTLKNFKMWLGTRDLMLVNQLSVDNYLQSLVEKNEKPSYVRTAFSSLNQTYRFLKHKKLILQNPCHKIKLSRLPMKLCIVSEKQIEQLTRFIKNPESNAEQALILSLVLFFALTPRELAQSQCLVQNDRLALILRRKPTSYGKHFYNREQILKLPQTPSWFLKLQKTFLNQWQNEYQKTKKTYPLKPLLLPRHRNYNRPLSSDQARKRIKEATIKATGHYIPARILRQTCGHLYSKNGDASILSRMGWSQQFSFCYTWLPRTFFSTESSLT